MLAGLKLFRKKKLLWNNFRSNWFLKIFTKIIVKQLRWSSLFLIKWDSHLPKKLHCLFHWKPCKNDKNAFDLILKAHFVLKIFKFLSWLFDHAEKSASLERFNFKIHDVTTWLINNCNTHIVQYLTN